MSSNRLLTRAARIVPEPRPSGIGWLNEVNGMIRRFLSRVAATNQPVAAPARDHDRTVELTPDLLLAALTNPAEAHRKGNDLAQGRYGSGVELGKDVRISHPLDQILHLPWEAIWSDPQAAIVRDSIEELIDASKDLTHDEIFNRHYGPVDPASYNLAAYMRCTRLRILRLHRALERRGIRGGTILEVGALYGCFAFILQRLGYQVTAVDRYQSYGPGFQPLITLMKRAGVEVVSTTREDEDHALASLGEYGFGIAMAVVEHIPHTPRLFLEQLRGCVRTGGVIAVDTPNLARYWNRVKLQAGESVFMDIKSQYDTDIPYEGHHREYTAAELRWIFEQLGCAEIETEYFDYNLLQFEAIDRPHIECLLRVIEDPAQADTILVTGRVSRLQ
jgi:2-polyprenyl-3-methyl-5-hydroxy-6-metoxy-1,4-benzoquinol methylase